MKLALILAAAAQAVAAANLKEAQQYISTSLKFRQTLRVCNAYPYSEGGVLVMKKVLPYKGCADVDKPLTKGEQVDFYAPDKSVLIGSFEISDLPQEDALLFLLIQAHDEVSTGVKFQSHMFSNSGDSQLALFDSYVGTKSGSKTLLTISDLAQKDPNHAERNEDLLFNTVVAVHPGDYEVFVAGKEKKTQNKLHAGTSGKYAVVRVGVNGGDKASYPEGLIVFPSSATGVSAVASLLLAVGFWLF